MKRKSFLKSLGTLLVAPVVISSIKTEPEKELPKDIPVDPYPYFRTRDSEVKNTGGIWNYIEWNGLCIGDKVQGRSGKIYICNNIYDEKALLIPVDHSLDSIIIDRFSFTENFDILTNGNL